MIWGFVDKHGRVGKLKMVEGGRALTVTTASDRELTRIPIGKVLIALPFIGAELFARYVLSRIWHVFAANSMRRYDDRQPIEPLSGLWKYGVIVTGRPYVRKEEDE